MLVSRLDVPVYGAQTMAFVVDAGAIVRFREGLRRAVGEGDASGMQALWDEVSPAFFEERARTRWRVPGATLRALLDLGEWRAMGLEYDRARVLASISSTRAWLGERDHVDVIPETWFALEGARGRLRDGLLPSLYLDMLASLLGELRDGRHEPVYGEVPAGPRGDLGWVRAVRAGIDEIDRSVRPLAGLRNWMRDEIADPPPGLAGWSPAHALDRACEELAAEEVLHAIVGPYRSSVGPGPFLPAPDAAEPLDDPRWPRLPLFERPSWDGGPPRVIEGGVLTGAAIDDAIDEVRAAEPGIAWWSDFERRLQHDVGTTASGWRDLDAVVSEWPRLRDRHLDALDRARRGGAAVLVVPARLCDQGPVEGPAEPGDGEPVR